MQSLRPQPVGPDARLYVDEFGRAILYLQPTPVRNGDLLVTDDIVRPGRSGAPWSSARTSWSDTTRCSSAVTRMPAGAGSCSLHKGKVWVDGIQHHREKNMPSIVAVLPFPAQLLLRRVLEDPATGTRIALYGDPNAPLNKRVQVRVGQRGRPTEWHAARVTGVSADARYVHTLLGTLDLQAGLWRERAMEALPLSAHGLPEEDEWGAPLTRSLTPDSTRALLALCALIVGRCSGSPWATRSDDVTSTDTHVTPDPGVEGGGTMQGRKWIVVVVAGALAAALGFAMAVHTPDADGRAVRHDPVMPITTITDVTSATTPSHRRRRPTADRSPRRRASPRAPAPGEIAGGFRISAARTLTCLGVDGCWVRVVPPPGARRTRCRRSRSSTGCRPTRSVSRAELPTESRREKRKEPDHGDREPHGRLARSPAGTAHAAARRARHDRRPSRSRGQPVRAREGRAARARRADRRRAVRGPRRRARAVRPHDVHRARHPEVVVATAPGCGEHPAPEYGMPLDAGGASVDLREALPRRQARRPVPVRMALLPGTGPELCAEGILDAGLDLAVAPHLGHAEAPSRCRPPGVARASRVRKALAPSDGGLLARAVLERWGWDIAPWRAALGPEQPADAGHRGTRDALVEQLVLAATLLAIVGAVPESRNAAVRMAVELLGH